MKRIVIAAAGAAVALGIVAAPSASAAPPHPHGWACRGIAATGGWASSYIPWGEEFTNFGAAKRFHHDTGALRVTCTDR
ncbi:hypothetical protein P0W64_14950 [Tsukamurella sp. 8F]|uniref:hypothetical protein n=1 Tax=unclassified Tsukamurella TaxID=2633480 RepID=UPI0023B924BE|nr:MULTISPECIES: hypothetical protein [unclassified Tsukamurella]MDF0532220.1 hypothetical protein [Tsukamurella sp. 8J]MDF0588075.1 hypothetical protein [Tsukamurella sp. 8F]